VRAWLTKHGVEEARLSSAGYGPDRPIADNKTDDGRRQNRRVEFHIVGDEGSQSTTVTAPAKP
jgi:outer membrane protein OmpA-like peptidoglycan-associated protein